MNDRYIIIPLRCFLILDTIDALLLCRLYDLHKSFDEVFISNSGLSWDLQKSQSTIKRSLAALQKMKLIKTSINHKERRIIELTKKAINIFDDPKKIKDKKILTEFDKLWND